MTSATILADSINENGNRLTTLSVRFHRFILPEFNTHRQFSRNFSSSRAIPVSKLIQSVLDDPAMPVSWGANKAGMQAGSEIDNQVKSVFVDDFLSKEDAWKEALQRAVESAKAFNEAGYHKQVVNRLIEPFMWATGVVTATEWDNFFNLRDHDAAQPEIRLLAQKIKEAMNNSTPKLLQQGQWHLPYILEEEKELPINVQKKISVARVARVSYKTHDTGVTSTVDKDVQLHDMLKDEGHLSPFESVARLSDFREYEAEANFRGFIQYRASVEEELYYKRTQGN